MENPLLDSLFGLLFILLWFVGLKNISKCSGWKALAQKYEFKGKFHGKLLRCHGLGGSTHIGANEDGLYFAMIFVFRPFHKPLLVPWQDIKVVRRKYLMRKGYKLIFPQVPEVRKKFFFLYRYYRFFFFDRTFEKLATYVPEEIKTLLEKIEL